MIVMVALRLKREDVDVPVWTDTGRIDDRMFPPLPERTLSFIRQHRYVTDWRTS